MKLLTRRRVVITGAALIASPAIVRAGWLPLAVAPNFVDPTSVPGLKLWLTSASSSNYTYGTPPAIQVWKDSSSNAKDATQLTTTKQPNDSSVATLNGHNTVRFNPGAFTEYLDVGAFVQAQPFTVFVEINGGFGTNNNRVFDATSNASLVEVMFGVSGNHLGMNAGAGLLLGTTAYNTNVYHTATMIFNGASSFIREDGVQTNSGNVGSNNLATLRIGGAWYGGDGLNAYLSSFLIYAGALTTPQIANIETYIGAH